MSEPIPAYLSELPRHGVYPIPFFTLIAKDGKPDFRAHDSHRHSIAMRRRLCGVCGKALDYWIWFIGGPASLAERLSYMPAMHEACARYSMRICPFLALEDHKHSTRPPRAGNVLLVSEDDAPPKPARAALVQTRKYEIEYPRGPVPGTEYAAYAAPKRVEWHRYAEGKLVPE